MCDACAGKGLELFLEYSYALDWRHPYFYPRDSVQLDWPYAGLDENLTPAKSFQTNEDFLHYIKYAHAQLKEILYRYVPLAGNRSDTGYRLLRSPGSIPSGHDLPDYSRSATARLDLL